jgi:hypothetical protein
MIATVPVARVAPFEKAVDRDFHRQTKRCERDRNLYHGLWRPHRVIFDHLGVGRLTANQGCIGKTCTSADFNKLNIFNH